MKVKARELVENLDSQSLALLEDWAVRQRGILAVYAVTRGQSRKIAGLPADSFRLETFDEDAAGLDEDDSIFAVLIGRLAHPLAREEAGAYSRMELFESCEEIAELCREGLEL
jgi:hypothetical protein